MDDVEQNTARNHEHVGANIHQHLGKRGTRANGEGRWRGGTGVGQEKAARQWSDGDGGHTHVLMRLALAERTLDCLASLSRERRYTMAGVVKPHIIILTI